jgi:hypothetical protein
MRISTLFVLLILAVSSLKAQSYQQIEATEYDPTQNRWLTSNGSSIIAQDASGTLSFFGNGSASHGMEVMNGTLFAISSSTIKGYDLISGDEVMSLTIPGALFLNGMGSDPATNRLWVSDFNAYKIIEIDVSDLFAPSQQTIVTETVDKPNGVVYDQIDDRLIFVSWGSNAAIKAVDLSDYSVSTLLSTSLGNMDGIDMNAAGEFFISTWSPTRITRYAHDFTNPETITAPGLAQPADISYGNEINTLGVANSGNETLTLIEFETSGLEDEILDLLQIDIFPNPVATGSRISFELEQSEAVQLNIRDVQGRLVSELLNEQMISGNHQVILNGLNIDEGMYLLEIIVSDRRVASPFVVAR